MRLLIPLVMSCAIVVAPVAAETPDRLLSTPAAKPVPESGALVYRHRQAGGQGAFGQAALDRTIRLERLAGQASVVATVEAGGASWRLAEFRGTTGNPVALLFIDSVVARLSEASGANPFYLRKQMKEALRHREERPVVALHRGASVAASEMTLRPFDGDPHAEELGALAGLELAFVLADSAPGGFVSLRATAGAGPERYFEEIVLNDTE